MFTRDSALSRSTDQAMYKVYGWMSFGLMITAATAMLLYANPSVLMTFISSKFAFWGVALLQIALVFYISAYINTMDYSAAVASFLLYSSLVGVTLAPVLLVYTHASIAPTFIVTAGMFGGMALYGYYTESDLSKFGNVLLMGLFGLVIATFANMFFASSAFEYAISVIGVLLFTALTAYDVQTIKESLARVSYSQDVSLHNKVALFGALKLYLDFINLFIYLLRFLGKKRD